MYPYIFELIIKSLETLEAVKIIRQVVKVLSHIFRITCCWGTEIRKGITAEKRYDTIY